MPQLPEACAIPGVPTAFTRVKDALTLRGSSMTGNELRAQYLDFYRQRGHAVVPSASLVPDNDPTTLFTGSGMQPMLPFLLGEPHPLGRRIADSQRCFRVQDIEE